jgi:NAD(P)-dependent dehydrogenase (short-subunit alcohol dehydrogenase family)
MQTILITGASRGIGRALARKFLDQGDAVIGTSRTGIADFAHQNLLFIPLELTDAQSIEACANAVAALNKKIDILVNNAGIWHPKDEHKTIEIPTLRETLEANLFGPINFTERLLPLMNDGGHIINLSSRRGSMSYTTESLYPCYGISKAALNMFTRNLAARLKGKQTVSCVHPGYVKTDMNEGAGDITAEEAADDIYQLARSNVETGQFWFKGEKFPW